MSRAPVGGGGGGGGGDRNGGPTGAHPPVRAPLRTGDWVAEQRRRYAPPPPPVPPLRRFWERLRAAPELPIAVLFLAGVATLLTVRAVKAREQVRTEIVRSLEESFPYTENDVETWADSRSAQAALLARVVADAPPGTDTRAIVARFDPVFRQLEVRGTYDGVRLVPASEAPPEAPSEAGAIRVNVHPVRTDAGVGADFVAPVRRDPTAVAEQYVVLRTRLRDTTFRNLDPSRRSSVGGRSMLLAVVGDSLFVASVRSRSLPTPDVRAFPLARAPAHLRLALSGRQTSGIGPGLFGTEVAYATHPVLARGWLLLREQEMAPIYHYVNRATAIEEGALALLALALVGVVVGRVRAARAKREQALTELRADFVASASHELRTPLAQIRMFAELMRKGSLRTSEDTDRALRVIEKEANRLTILVDNILNFTRLRKRVSREVPIPSRVAEEVRQVVQDFAPLAADRKVRVEAEVDEEAVALVDSLALRQVLLNFLENAVKYGPRGGTVRVRAESAGEDRVRVSVEDQGPGIPEGEREKVWRAFYRRQESIESGETGSGIGLAVVRELVTQFGGTTSVDGVAGGGARFVAEFPGA